ncbi:hypothetical protein HPP92_006671 [Vanilla planifolia]|uniref:Bifunctional inhibitor/plant lipid transfer protein/seed storage helical domain-containing protein n=1 Tax=Vanilla planifolia TaxID=51239 RepID=A0A835RGR3_VANPL|nr:hypothetical protein HPP92_006671 [Vanilla planifolia]
MQKMTNSRLLILSLVIATITGERVHGQGNAVSPTSFAPSPAATGPDCFLALASLSSCLTFVEEGSNLTVPEKGCCFALAQLVDGQSICLCQLLSTSDVFGIKIDDTRALALPTVCRIQTPPPSLCNVLGNPVPSAEAMSPGGASQPGSSGGGGPMTPATQKAAPMSGSGGGFPQGFRTLLATVGQVMVTIGSIELSSIMLLNPHYGMITFGFE